MILVNFHRYSIVKTLHIFGFIFYFILGSPKDSVTPPINIKAATTAQLYDLEHSIFSPFYSKHSLFVFSVLEYSRYNQNNNTMMNKIKFP